MTATETTSSAKDARPALRGMTREAMRALLAEAGFERYRADQLYEWVFKRGAESPGAMANLPKPLRAWLDENTRMGGVELAELTGEPGRTQKALFRLADGELIESVVMRDDKNPASPSVCLSSQVGCAMACTFCMTGHGGYRRNLAPDEIIGQAIALRNALPEGQSIGHMVFMGMGEPMHNLGGVVPALKLLTDPDGFALSRRRITVSTVGMVTGIEQFGAEALGVGLAVSLNATTDEVRDVIMPINKKWPIKALMEALARYPLEQRRRITIEYVLMRGVNDTPGDAKRLVKLVGRLHCKVNLIMYNACPELAYEPVEEEVLDMFMKTLSDARLTVAVRWSKGYEIQAACGQLAAHAKKEAQ